MVRLLLLIFLLILSQIQCVETSTNSVTDGEGGLELDSAPVAALPLPSEDEAPVDTGTGNVEDVGDVGTVTETIVEEGDSTDPTQVPGGTTVTYATINTAYLIMTVPDSENNSVVITEPSEDNAGKTMLIETDYVENDANAAAVLLQRREGKNSTVDLFRSFFFRNALATPDLSICEEAGKICIEFDENGKAHEHPIPLDVDLMKQGLKPIFYISAIDAESGEIGPEIAEELRGNVTFVNSMPPEDKAITVSNRHDEFFFSTESGNVKKVNYVNKVFAMASGNYETDYSEGQVELPSVSDKVTAFELIEQKNNFLFLFKKRLWLTNAGSTNGEKYRRINGNDSLCDDNCWTTAFKIFATPDDHQIDIFYSTAVVDKPTAFGALINLNNGYEKPIIFNYFDKDTVDGKQLMHVETYDFVMVAKTSAALVFRGATLNDNYLLENPDTDILSNQLPEVFSSAHEENTEAYDFKTYFVVSSVVTEKKLKDPTTGTVYPNYKNIRIELPEIKEPTDMQMLSDACLTGQTDCTVSFIANNAIHFMRFNNPESNGPKQAEVIANITVGESVQGVVFHEESQSILILDSTSTADEGNPSGKVVVVSIKDIGSTKPQIVRVINIADHVLKNKKMPLSPTGLKLFRATDGTAHLILTSHKISSLISLELKDSFVESDE